MSEKLLFTLPLSIIIVAYSATIIYLCILLLGFLHIIYEVLNGVSILLLDRENVEIRKSKFISYIDWFMAIVDEQLEKKELDSNKLNIIANNFKIDKKIGFKSFFKLLFTLLTRQFFRNPFAFFNTTSYYSLRIPAVVGQRAFKKNPQINFVISIFFSYLLPFSIITFLGYGVSIYNSTLSIILAGIYISFVIYNHEINFNDYLLGKFENQTRNLSKYMTSLICLLIGFASIYYNLYKINSYNFICHNNHLGIVDSIYFSIVTFATVGYGEIIPNSNLTKILVSTEIFVSIFVLIIIVSSYINKEIVQSKQKD